MNLRDTTIGIEFGSTRIKAVMIDRRHNSIASGSYGWENTLSNGIWTYSMQEVLFGLQSCFKDLKMDFERRFGQRLTATGAIGISAMMHGYIALDDHDRLLVPFRTWRNTTTGEAAAELTELFDFNIPQRWSVAHLYQAVLNNEEHVPMVSKVATLASYVHYLLTGCFVSGVGDASGMFPIDSTTITYDRKMEGKFNALLSKKGLKLNLDSILPKVLKAGDDAGFLTSEGSLIIDPTGEFESGIRMAPPEGDAGTGMVATNSVAVYTGNVSAGTSDFAMVVLDHIPGRHRELDLVTTPSGEAVAMVHCNNCTTDIDNWIGLFGDFAKEFGMDIPKDELFSKLYGIALEGEPDCGGLLSCNYHSGEGVTDFDRGLPMFLHPTESQMSVANFMRCHLYSALSTLKIGMDVLKVENIRINRILAHGGFFKTGMAGQRMLSAALGVPVSSMETAGEGGPYGMALLCAFMLWNEGESLASYLEDKVYKGMEVSTIKADASEFSGFDAFVANYRRLLEVERKAVEVF